MRERLQQFWESVKEWWGRLSRVARIVLLSCLAGVLVGCIVLAVLLNQKTYVLLYNDLSTTEHAKVLAVLSEQGIEARVEPSGAILVLDSDLNKARMQLATQGLPGSSFDTSYSPGLTATQTDKNYLQNNELQKRLQATIETFDEVKQAVVTISQPERNAFALQSEVLPPKATIMIVKRTGRNLSAEQVQGIINIVQHSVPGLTEDNISIADETGDLKAAYDTGVDVNNAKLRLMEEINTTFRTRALSMLQPIYGAENVRVAFNSVLDTDEKVTEKITYDPLDPENPERNPLDYTEHDRQKVADGTGIVEGVPGANDNVGTPQYGEEDGELANLANYSSHDIYDYLVGSTKEQIKKEGLSITDMTAAVVVNQATLSGEERDRITAIVANASGLAVENVTVQNFEFARADEVAVDPLTGMTPLQLLILAAIILLVLIILIVIIIIIVSKRKKDGEEETDEQQELLYDEDGVPLLDLMSQEEDFEPITIVETAEQKLKAQIKDLADSDPEIVASLLKTWLTSQN